jgi:putative Mg2+ transporter-C (MgtC) family protein
MYLNQEDIYKLVLAVVLGGLIGIEREFRGKAAGFRTMILICIGSTLFTMLSLNIGMATQTMDRIASNIVTGIGFLGAGVIFKDENRVNGMTTASAIWASAAVGMCIGNNEKGLAVATTGIILIVLVIFGFLQTYLERRYQARDYKIVCKYNDRTLHHYEKLFSQYRLRAVRGKQVKQAGRMAGEWRVVGTLSRHDKIIHELLNDPDIIELDF